MTRIRATILISATLVACFTPDAGADLGGGGGSGGGESDGGGSSSEGGAASSTAEIETGSSESGMSENESESGEPPENCGDGIVDPSEECDAGAANGSGEPCKADCTLNVCGDGDVGPREACDDGNDVDTDACLVGCVAAACGDGHIAAGIEDCEDFNDVDGDGCSSSCHTEPGWECEGGACSAICGDGVVVGSECCDDGNSENEDDCPDSCSLDQRRVFVTSSVQTPEAFDGVSGADFLCQNVAVNAGLPGRYRAWISDSSSSPSTRFNLTDACDVPYRLVDGTQIASNWSDLTDGTIAMPIAVSEAGGVVDTPFVWTGTQTDGAADTLHCDDWTPTADGRIGYATMSNFAWTAGTSGGCQGAYRLFCFQQ